MNVTLEEAKASQHYDAAIDGEGHIFIIPILAPEKKAIGALHVVTALAHPIERMSILANAVSKCIDHISSIQKLLKSAKRFQTIMQDLEVDRSIANVVNFARAMLSCDRATLFLVDHGSQKLVTKSATGVDSIKIPLNQKSIAGRDCIDRRSLNIRDVYNHTFFNRSIDEKTGYRTKSVACVPVEAGGQSPRRLAGYK